MRFMWNNNSYDEEKKAVASTGDVEKYRSVSNYILFKNYYYYTMTIKS